MGDPLVKAESLSFSYIERGESLLALEDIDLELERGEFLSIIGPSGCGKTSLLKLIAGLHKASSGKLEVDESGKNAGFVFQSPSLFPWLTVEKNITKPLSFRGVLAGEQKKRVQSVLELVGLKEFSNKYPWQLSGGMQQRASIARALAANPELLLMDEPFGALDEISRESMNLELYRIWQDTGKTICFVTHSVPEAVFLSSRILVLSPRPGKIVKDIKSNLPSKRDLATLDTETFRKLSNKVRLALRLCGGV